MKGKLALTAALIGFVGLGGLAIWYYGTDRPVAEGDGAASFARGAGSAQEPEAKEFAFRRLEIETSKARAEACLVFTHALDERGKTRYGDYLTIDPKIPVVARAVGSRLCLSGLAFNASYKVELKAGLPAASGERLALAEMVPVDLQDKPALLRFTGGIILPRDNQQAVPVQTVNVEKLALKIVRVGDRLLSQLGSGLLDQTALYSWDRDQLETQQGAVIWEGEMEVAREGGKLVRNATVTTLIPVREVLKNHPNGAYVLFARDAAKPVEEGGYDYAAMATQWVIASDIALTSFKGGEGLSVFARSYANTKPLTGVKLSLIARDNNVLASVTTDGAGRADFAPGLLRGKGGDEPVMVMAYGPAQDFAFLDLRRPAFDLTDRGVGGRMSPGPVDAYLYTERGVYRPGETVQLVAMLRDRVGKAMKAPLTLMATRPDGVDVSRKIISPGSLKAGAAQWALPLTVTAPHGRWQIAAHIDPKGPAVGRVQFDVADFVPQRLAVELTPQQAMLQKGEAFSVKAQTRFLYGAPAAGLSGDAEARLTRHAKPFANFAAYHFGRVEETFEDVLLPLTVTRSDQNGVSEVRGRLAEIAASSLPLKAVMRVSIHEPGGRSTDKQVELPIASQAVWLGLRPDFDNESVAEQARAGFEIVALDGAGRRIARPGLSYTWYREDTQYHWYQVDGEWRYQAITQDRLLKTGTIDVEASKPARLAEAQSWGRYRLELRDPQSGAVSSYRYYSGWSANAVRDRPDRIPVAADKPRYGVGQIARVSIKPDADGRALIVVAGDRIFSSQMIRAPKSGAVVEIPVSADWGAGAYILVTHYRALDEATGREPVRSIGLAWLAVDNGPRQLGVEIGGPKNLIPRQKIALPVTVQGLARNETTYLTLAAVDEGILQLTDFKSPDPGKHYFGKRRLGVGMRDDYGRLIKNHAGVVGSLRQGGDAYGGRPLAVVPTRTVALFSGIVTPDANGVAQIPLELPDFNGGLRLMAVAFSENKLGQGERHLTLRDRVVADLVLPRFMAPRDQARLGLHLHNVDGVSGQYQLILQTTGALRFADGKSEMKLVQSLKAGEKVLLPVELLGQAAGIGGVTLKLHGPGLNVERAWPIEIRQPQMEISREEIASLPPGQDYVADRRLVQDVLPRGAQVAVNLSSTLPAYTNIRGQMRWLKAYPYGCVEQIVSAAFPLLWFEADAGSGRAQVQESIDTLLDRQSGAGSFAIWGPGSSGDQFSSIFALDFLVEAKAKNYVVPEDALRRGANWMKLVASSDSYSDTSRAYAFYVLARLGQMNLSEMRYFSDARGPQFKSAMAAGLLGAAAASSGDRSRTTLLFDRARAILLQAQVGDYAAQDYGSLLRDLAAVTALAVESDEPRLLPALVQRSRNVDMRISATTTQEKAWILRAGHALEKQASPISIQVNGKAMEEKSGALRLQPDMQALTQGLTVRNQGKGAVWRMALVQGVSAQALPAMAQGLSLRKTIWTLSGQPADLASLKQNERVIVLLSGQMENHAQRQMGVIDLLPAGLEIEMPLSGDDVKAYPFIEKVTPLSMQSARDDRFVASFQIGWPGRFDAQYMQAKPQFRVAYIARAVTQGRFVLPAAIVEDMYAPAVKARTDMGGLSIQTP